MSQMSPDDAPTYGPADLYEALQHWKSARATLTRAIKHYVDASTGLCSVLASSLSHWSTEQTLAEINSKLQSLQLEEQRLYKTRANLSDVRNMSRDLVPIHRLPREVQSTIFGLSRRYCPEWASKVGYSRSQAPFEISPMTLAAVCSRWRKLVIQSPSLWSHIDVVFGHNRQLIDFERTELWVERSHGVPLDIHIWESKARGTWLHRMPSTGEIERTIELLAPLMSRTVDLRINVASQEILDQIIECWFRHSLPTVPKSLHVLNPSHEVEPLVLRAGLAAESEDLAEKFSKVFLACRQLTLENCRILAPASFSGGLVKLHLQRSSSPIALPELLAILAANPRLRILVLLDVIIRSPEDEQEANGFPVTMNCLESLTIGYIDHSYNYHLFLPLLSIGSDTLNLSLYLSDDPEFVAAFHAFLYRTKVTTLHAQAASCFEAPAALLCSIPHVQTMAIDGRGVVWRDPSGLMEAHFYDNEHDPWPSLHTLYLEGGIFPIQFIQAFAQVRSVQRLHMYGVSVFEFESPMTKEERKQLDEIMGGVEDFGIYEWEKSPVRKWSFAYPV
ncbi:hypothetical protein FRC08_005664 [Ceratobasidium sp. 394]|nr:hypothetical protein FRC08_005664 [Ceratobasidium sp. 394]